jgi:hypothetical protein
MYNDGVLYIIGNGFDLHHGVSSSYGSFRIWLQKNNPALYGTYSTICKYDALWSDFETGMAYVDRRYFTSAAELFLPDYSKDSDEWQIADVLMAGDVARKQAEELIYNLKTSFHKWVLSIRPSKDYEKYKLMVDCEARFMTFNYTDFLETKYGISREQIKYIHGHKLSRNGNIIVGHAEDSYCFFEKWWKSQRYDELRTNKKGKKYYPRDYAYRAYHSDLPEDEGVVNGVETYFEESRKPVERIIKDNKEYFDSLSDVRVIYVWGFSFNKVDMPYIKRILETNDNPSEIKWYVSFYSELELARFQNVLNSIGVETSMIEFKQLSAWQYKSYKS